MNGVGAGSRAGFDHGGSPSESLEASESSSEPLCLQ